MHISSPLSPAYGTGPHPPPLAFVTFAEVQIMLSLARMLTLSNSVLSLSSLRAQRIQLSHHFGRVSQGFPCQQSKGLA